MALIYSSPWFVVSEMTPQNGPCIGTMRNDFGSFWGPLIILKGEQPPHPLTTFGTSETQILRVWVAFGQFLVPLKMVRVLVQWEIVWSLLSDFSSKSSRNPFKNHTLSQSPINQKVIILISEQAMSLTLWETPYDPKMLRHPYDHSLPNLDGSHDTSEND